MQFALVNNEKVEAAPGLKGVCQGCAAPMIAHCGKKRSWHWTHHSTANCDRWWEPETEWHRAWKNQFPREWQEIRHHDKQNNEVHIADVLTVHGSVIEFQHSSIHPEERAAREAFYKNLIWIVDGTRLKRDYPRFRQRMNFRRSMMPGHFLVDFPEKCFPKDWVACRVPVIFDFRGLNAVDPPDPILDGLWCILPGRAGHHAVVVGMSAGNLVNTLSSRAQLIPYKETMALAEEVQRQEAKTAMSTAPRLLAVGPGRRQRF